MSDVVTAGALAERLLSLTTWCRQVRAVVTEDPGAVLPEPVSVDDLVRIAGELGRLGDLLEGMVSTTPQ